MKPTKKLSVHQKINEKAYFKHTMYYLSASYYIYRILKTL